MQRATLACMLSFRLPPTTETNFDLHAGAQHSMSLGNEPIYHGYNRAGGVCVSICPAHLSVLWLFVPVKELRNL